ncbi:MAG TPA: hypothetical protein VFT90_03540 [Chryseosolibacter sp.]|nr:hypothetical protein [Chryseosolibacter sp.]
MRLHLTILFFVITGVIHAQTAIEWNENYQLKLSDFQSPTTQIGDVSIYSLHSSASFDFSFHMSNAEFMFTKNFNSKVNCSFQPSAASLVAPDTAMANDLLAFARYGFDLSELYARKFRQRLFEEKGAFSNINFMMPIYDEIQKELAERHTVAARTTDIGRNRVELKSIHEAVLAEIQQLADFCKTCKPPKGKKSKE